MQAFESRGVRAQHLESIPQALFEDLESIPGAMHPESTPHLESIPQARGAGSRERPRFASRVETLPSILSFPMPPDARHLRF